MRWQLGYSCASPSRTDQTLRNSKDSSISFFFSSARLMCIGTDWETPLSLILILILLFLATLHWSTVRESASINNVDPSEHPPLLFLGINSIAYSKCSPNMWTWEMLRQWGVITRMLKTHTWTISSLQGSFLRSENLLLDTKKCKTLELLSSHSDREGGLALHKHISLDAPLCHCHGNPEALLP